MPDLSTTSTRPIEYLKKVVTRNSAKKTKKRSAQTYMLQLSGSQQLDVRGMTDEQMKGQG